MAEIPKYINKEDLGFLLDFIKEDQVEKARKELPHLNDNTQQIKLSRGSILETSIIIETIYNQMLMYHKGMSEEDVLSKSFAQKTNDIISLIEENLEESNWKINLIKKMREIKDLRNLYAHVPQDYFNSEARFNPHDKYYENEFIKKFREVPLKEIDKAFEERTKDFTEEMYKVIKYLILKGK